MLRSETVKGELFELLRQLMDDPITEDFNLAGGTALSLFLGHRESIDLDLFTVNTFDAAVLEKHLESKYGFKKSFGKDRNTLIGHINDIKTDLIRHPYPYAASLTIKNGIRLYSMNDIAAMKLSAIADNGTRLKDFVDIAFLSEKMSLKEMLKSYQKVYDKDDYFYAVRGLSYFRDIDFSIRIKLMKGKFEWNLIQDRIIEMIRNEEKIFEPLFS